MGLALDPSIKELFCLTITNSFFQHVIIGQVTKKFLKFWNFGESPGWVVYDPVILYETWSVASLFLLQHKTESCHEEEWCHWKAVPASNFEMRT